MSKTEELRKKLKAKLAETKSTLAAQRQLDVDLDTLIQITSNEFYTEKVIRTIGTNLARQYQLNEQDQFEVIGSSRHLSQFLRSKNSINLSQKPIFLICNKRSNYWATLCLIQIDTIINVLYKDPSSNLIPESIISELKQIFSPLNVQFFINCVELLQNDSIKVQDYCPMSLKNMEIMIQGAMGGPEQFIKRFETLNFSNHVEIGLIKADLKLGLVQPEIENIVANFEPNNQSKIELQNFMVFAVNANIQLSQPVNNYVQILKAEMSKRELDDNYELDLTAINSARSGFNINLDGFDQEIKKIGPILNVLERYKEIHSPGLKVDKNADQNSSNNENKPDNLTATLEKFTRIFALLKGTQETERLNQLLGRLALKFGIEDSTLKSFFQVEVLKQGTNLKLEKDKSPISLSAQELSKLLPIPKAKPNPVLSKPKGRVKSLEQVLAEIAISKDIKENEVIHSSQMEEQFQVKYRDNEKILTLERNMKSIEKFWEDWKEKDIFTIRDWADKMRGGKLSKDNKDPTVLEAMARMHNGHLSRF